MTAVSFVDRDVAAAITAHNLIDIKTRPNDEEVREGRARRIAAARAKRKRIDQQQAALSGEGLRF